MAAAAGGGGQITRWDPFVDVNVGFMRSLFASLRVAALVLCVGAGTWEMDFEHPRLNVSTRQALNRMHSLRCWRRVDLLEKLGGGGGTWEGQSCLRDHGHM